jgi:hypothetical protein
MNKPKRIQRSRSKGWKMPANASYVGRPIVWGNPYMVSSELVNGETLTAEKLSSYTSSTWLIISASATSAPFGAFHFHSPSLVCRELGPPTI